MNQQFTNAEKQAEAEREVKMRYQVYARHSADGQLSQREKRWIAIMQEIAAEYRELAERERLL